MVSLIDAPDRVVLFRPYYFNHLMAVQMTGGHESVIIGETDAGLVPDMDWLSRAFENQNQNQHQNKPSEGQGQKIKLVVIVNPGNPSGTLVPRKVLERAAQLCKQNDAWLVCLCWGIAIARVVGVDTITITTVR